MAPAHMMVRPNQDDSAVAHLAGLRPLPQVILPVLARANGVGGDLDAGLFADRLRRVYPAFAADPGEQREPSVASQIKGRYFPLVIEEPDMRQPRAGPSGGLIMQFRILREFGLGNAVGHD